MKRAMIFSLLACVATAPAMCEPVGSRPLHGVVKDFDPTSPGLHDYAPPTPVGRGHAGAYVGAGYMEYLFSGDSPPHLPPRRVYVGPLESQPYGNRRLRLREGQSPRAGIYMGIPEGAVLVPY